MKEIKKVLLCGLGAVGSVFAEKISADKDIDFKVLIDENRFEKYINAPLIFNGQELNFDYILPAENDFKADLIIITTKFSGLVDAAQNIKNFVKKDTIILSLLNGISSEEILAEKYGKEKLLLSYFICHSAVREGREVSFDGFGKVVFGKSEKIGSDENVCKVKEFFEKIKMNYEIPIDMEYSMWLKFMLNIAANPLSAILRMDFGEMLSNRKYLDLAVEAMRAVQLIAKAEGVNSTENMIEKTIENLQTMLPKGKTSMLQDIEAGRKTEIEMLCGTVVKLGKKHGIPTPINKVLYEMIEIIQESKKED